MITLGSVVHRELLVLDSDGNLVTPATKTLTVFKPDGTNTDISGSVTTVSTGLLAIDYNPATVGRYVLKWRTTSPQTALDQEFDVFAAAVEPRVTLAEVKTYLGTTSWSDADITDVMNSELSAQDARCRRLPTYPPDLKQALFRRVARALALRSLPVGIQSNDSGAYIGGRDPEISRLEAPYRKWSVG